MAKTWDEMRGAPVKVAEPVKVKRAKVARKPQRPAMQPTIIARDGGKPEPCPRCGRADFRTAVGRTWHLENNPDCSKYRRPDRHHYAAA